ncbi:MAG TPA: hypothetical protein VIL72_02490, partial [Beijerinckiaceae bacterium]
QRARPPASPPTPPPRPADLVPKPAPPAEKVEKGDKVDKAEKGEKGEKAADAPAPTKEAPPQAAQSTQPPARTLEPPAFVLRKETPATILMRCSLENGLVIRFAFDRAANAFRLEPGGAHPIETTRFMEDMLILDAKTQGDVAMSARIGARSFLSLREAGGPLRLLPCFDVDAQ